ncbi:hypothetical protein A2U01_0086125, partial [Trifolium medium]|nr:hypothetical protein [Trifolium medium]
SEVCVSSDSEVCVGSDSEVSTIPEPPV